MSFVALIYLFIYCLSDLFKKQLKVEYILYTVKNQVIFAFI